MELSERLKAFGAKSEIYFGCDEDDEIWQDCGKYVLENLPAIIAAIQFAEDMEKLRESMVPFSMYPQTDGSVFIVIGLLNKDKEFHSSDIYTAARKAAEAMGKGEA